MNNCPRCNKEFKQKSHLKNHLMKTKKCPKNFSQLSRKDIIALISTNNKNVDNTICKYCSKKFSCKNNNYRHMKHTCKVAQIINERKQLNDKYLETKFKQLEFEHNMGNNKNEDFYQIIKDYNDKIMELTQKLNTLELELNKNKSLNTTQITGDSNAISTHGTANNTTNRILAWIYEVI